MSDTDKKTEEGDEILRRMLKSPPQPKETEKEDDKTGGNTRKSSKTD